VQIGLDLPMSSVVEHAPSVNFATFRKRLETKYQLEVATMRVNPTQQRGRHEAHEGHDPRQKKARLTGFDAGPGSNELHGACAIWEQEKRSAQEHMEEKTRKKERKTAVRKMLGEGMLTLNIDMLHAALKDGAAIGLSKRELMAASKVLQGTVRLRLEEATHSGNFDMLTSALRAAERANLQEGELVRARCILKRKGTSCVGHDVNTIQKLCPDIDACMICFYPSDATMMPCCGREGSSNRVCSGCLEKVCVAARNRGTNPQCPVCRASLTQPDSSSADCPKTNSHVLANLAHLHQSRSLLVEPGISPRLVLQAAKGRSLHDFLTALAVASKSVPDRTITLTA